MTFLRTFSPRLLVRNLVFSSLLLSPFAAYAAPSSPDFSALPAANLQAKNDLNAAFQKVLRSKAGRQIDPELQLADAFKVRMHSIGNQKVVRITPLLDGIEVEGADRLLTYRAQQAQNWSRSSSVPLRPKTFRLSSGEALLKAHAITQGSLFKDPTVERVSGFAKKVYLATGNTLRPAWKIRVPTLHLHDLMNVWIDAETGKVLRRQQAAYFADGGILDGGALDAGIISDGGALDAGAELDASIVVDSGLSDAGATAEEDAGTPTELPAAPTKARVFQWAPPGTGLDPTQLIEVDLPMLYPAEVGGALRGTHVETFNCCKEYVCNDGSSECNVSERRCATDDDEFPIESTLALEVPSDILPISFPSDTIYARTVFCSELPKVRSKPADGDRPAGFFESPVDSTRENNALLGLASEEDAFSEVQAYYTTMMFFLHMRDILNDDTWCLGGKSMQCDADGNIALDENGKPIQPFHVATNVLLPELDFTAIGGQIFAGAGQDPGNPVIIDDFQRMDNAAFIPALSGSPIEVPPELTALLEVFNRPYDSNVYFQGNRDFAYDGSIVFHEFTHAVVYSFVPSLGSLGKDAFGGQAESGALNEGWADYFSASIRNESSIGEYGARNLVAGELALRNSENDLSCPKDTIGQVHNDSQPWSAALWELRTAVIAANGQEAVKDLDQVVLLSMAQADNDETLEKAAARILTNVENGFNSALRDAAEAAFNRHGILGCERIIPLVTIADDGTLQNTPKNTLHVSGPSDISLDNLAPAPLQFVVEVPATATGFSLSWAQSTGGTAGQFTGQGEVAPFNILVSEQEGSIEWRYEGSGERNATPYDNVGNALAFVSDESNLAEYTGENGSFTYAFEPDECTARRFVVQFVAADSSGIASNISASVFLDENLSCNAEAADAGTGAPTDSTDPEAPEGCGCSIGDSDASPPQPMLFAAMLLLGFGLSLRRRKNQSLYS